MQFFLHFVQKFAWYGMEDSGTAQQREKSPQIEKLSIKCKTFGKNREKTAPYT